VVKEGIVSMVANATKGSMCAAKKCSRLKKMVGSYIRTNQKFL
jgi:hypothetical protein